MPRDSFGVKSQKTSRVVVEDRLALLLGEPRDVFEAPEDRRRRPRIRTDEELGDPRFLPRCKVDGAFLAANRVGCAL